MTRSNAQLTLRHVATMIAMIASIGALASCASAVPPATPSSTPSVAASSGASALFVGHYEVRPGADFIVTMQDGMLFGDFPARPGAKREMRLISDTTFDMGNGYHVLFEVDALGVARAATLMHGEEKVWRAPRHDA